MEFCNLLQIAPMLNLDLPRDRIVITRLSLGEDFLPVFFVVDSDRCTAKFPGSFNPSFLLHAIVSHPVVDFHFLSMEGDTFEFCDSDPLTEIHVKLNV